MADVVLLYPKMPEEAGSYSQEMIPLGLSWIAAYLESSGIDVKMFDLQVEDIDLEEMLKREKPLLVGLGGTAESRFEVFRIASSIKEADPSVTVAFGGPQATFTAQDTLSNVAQIDVIVRGEGERTMLALHEGCAERNADLSAINGISYRQNGVIIHNPARARIGNLDEIPPPARHLLKMERYYLEMDFLGIKGGAIITSRGCPFNCAFCSAALMWGGTYTTRSAAGVIAEIKQVVGRYGAKGIKFFDSTFTISRKHVMDICDAMREEGLNHLPWECEVRADTVDREMLRNMRDAGCYYIDIGLESASDRVLQNINKRIRVEQVEEILEYSLEAGLRVKLFLLWGHPHETMEDLEKTIRFIKKWRRKLPNLAAAGAVRVYPGTAVERFAREKGYLPGEFSWSGPYYCEENERIDNSPYIPVLPVLIERRERGYKLRGRITGFHMRTRYTPSFFMKKILDIRSFADIVRYARSLGKVLLRCVKG